MIPQRRHNFHYFLKTSYISELDDSVTGVKNLNTRQLISIDEKHTYAIYCIVSALQHTLQVYSKC